MKTAKGFYSCLTAALLIVLSSAGIAVAQTNTHYGTGALAADPTGTDYDSALGYDALNSSTTGQNNTADGAYALFSNVTGSANTATGAYALFSNTTTAGLAGDNNTADGQAALYSNTTGNANTADGQAALYSNTTGVFNSANGAFALYSSTTGEDNTAAGAGALYSNTTGSGNTANGQAALYSNITGSNNAASGIDALWSNISGSANTAAGENALYSNTTGSNNIAIGYDGGYLVTGSNNIDIGNGGAAAESGIIRIGVPGTQTGTYIAGIFGNKKTKGCEVLVESSGRLECVKSSARYKRDIHAMAEASAGLMKLRPVTFRYKSDPDGTKQYGLVAEEVARVYPELVVRDADGKAESVSYWMLTSMLLNELQKQAAELKASHERELAMRSAFEERLSRLEQAMASKNGSRNLAAAFNR